MIPLRQSTASQEIFLGKFVDSTDGSTAEDALTINSVDIWLWKHGATTRVNPAAGATHMSQGDYYFVADATDSNTLGGLVISCQPSGARPVKAECVVFTANVFDSFFSTDKLQVDAVQVSGTTQTAGDNTLTINSIYGKVDTEIATMTTAINSVYTSVTDIHTDVADIHTDVADIHTDTGTAVTQTVAATIADAVLDEVVEGTTTLRQSVRLQNSALFGKLSGGGTSTLTFRNIADNTDRITATVDSNKNRTAVSLDSS